MKYLFLPLLIASLFWACQPQVEPAKIEKIESLQQALDSSAKQFSIIDSAKALSSVKEFQSKISYIKGDYRDTIQEETALYIDKYYSLRKAMKLMGNSYAETARDIRSTKSRLKNLLHDLKNGLVEDQQYEQYLELEENNVAIIKESVDALVRAYTEGQPMYDEMAPRIDSLISESKRKAAKVAE